TIKPNRMYNGKSDVTDAFISELKKGSINSSGFTAEDVEAHSVNLDFTTGHFKAQAYNLEYEDTTGTTIAAGTHADKNVGKDKPVKFTGSIDFSGDDAANYYFNNASLSNITGTATITKAPLYLKINKTRADAKIYDGTDAVLDLAMKQTGTTRPNITLNKDNYAPASTVPSPTHHKGEIMLDDGDNPDDVDLTQVTDPTYTDTTGAKQIHVGDHKLQYKNVGLRGADAGNYDLYLPPIPAVGNGNKVVGNTVYLDGKIIAREITRDSFKVYDRGTNAEVTAEKVYDGNATYTPGGGVYLSTNAPASGNVGIVTRDQGHITFALTGDKGTFKDAAGANSTKNVAEARKIAYNVTGVADTHTDSDGIGHKLDDYYVLDADGVTKHSLSSAFDATGQGRITPKALTATVVNNHITKVYDAKQNQTDGNRNDIIGDALVTLSGFVSGETRTNTSTAMYASPNVAWDNTANAPTSQTVTYTAKFDRGTGAEADNYTLDTTAHTTTVTNSASVSGSYTGTITPRDLKLTFGDVTKVYDGTADNATKNVTALDDGLSGAVTTADGTTAAGISAAALSSVTSSYGDFSGTTFNANRNAGSRAVEYVGLAGALGTNHNYAIADKQYGKGTITRRRIDPSGF
ncbi:MAG: filamentous hemagglutinin, partial [Selenomonas sp.]|nr:filamentous hemagglutinin [Selenomonas sp.]